MARKTSTKKTTIRKTSTSTPKTSVKTVPTTTEAAPTTAPEAKVLAELRKKEFIEKVAELSGQKKGVTKKIVEVALRELGDAVHRGDAINLPPLGKLSVNREKDVGGANIYITKLRRSKAMLEASAPDAEGDANGDADATSDAGAEVEAAQS